MCKLIVTLSESRCCVHMKPSYVCKYEIFHIAIMEKIQ